MELKLNWIWTSSNNLIINLLILGLKINLENTSLMVSKNSDSFFFLEYFSWCHEKRVVDGKIWRFCLFLAEIQLKLYFQKLEWKRDFTYSFDYVLSLNQSFYQFIQMT